MGRALSAEHHAAVVDLSLIWKALSKAAEITVEGQLKGNPVCSESPIMYQPALQSATSQAEDANSCR